MQSMSSIPENFIYTQQSLSTFENCPLKFKKRYVERLRWPGMMGDKARKRLELGNDFHLLARRYFSGIEPGVDESATNRHELYQWFISLKESFALEEHIIYLPEYKLKVNLHDYKLEANIDLIVIRDGSVEIWDWKTQNSENPKNTKRTKLLGSLQTAVYMFVLKEAVHHVLGGEVTTDKISMHYWQPQSPKIIGHIDYSDTMHEEFRRRIFEMMQHTRTYDYGAFDKNLYAAHCKHCEYNWLCNRRPINLDDLGEE